MIDTRSKFYYGYKITAQPINGLINIDEGGGEITIDVPVGTYTLSTLVQAIRNALLTQATLDYTVGVDRDSRKLTISATSSFDLLTNTGTNVGSSIWSLIGFDTATDKTGLMTYTSDFASGSQYSPQFFYRTMCHQKTFKESSKHLRT